MRRRRVLLEVCPEDPERILDEAKKICGFVLDDSSDAFRVFENRVWISGTIWENRIGTARAIKGVLQVSVDPRPPGSSS